MKAEQWQELCERAAWEAACFDDRFGKWWKRPGGESFCEALPPQDMNTLARWIWPKMTTNQRVAVLTIWSPLWVFGFEALADAIWKVVKRGS